MVNCKSPCSPVCEAREELSCSIARKDCEECENETKSSLRINCCTWIPFPKSHSHFEKRERERRKEKRAYIVHGSTFVKACSKAENSIPHHLGSHVQGLQNCSSSFWPRPFKSYDCRACHRANKDSVARGYLSKLKLSKSLESLNGTKGEECARRGVNRQLLGSKFYGALAAFSLD